MSTEVVLFMSGILSKQKDNEFVEKLIINKFLSDDLSADECTRGLLISKCLLQYEDIEFTKGLVRRFHDIFCIRNGHFDLSRVGMAYVDCPVVSFPLNVFGALNAEEESEWNRITTLELPVYVKNYRHQHVKSPNFIWVIIRSPMPVLSVFVKHYRHQHVKSPNLIWLVIRSPMPVLLVYVKHYRHQHVKSPHLICVVIRSPMPVLLVSVKHYKYQHGKYGEPFVPKLSLVSDETQSLELSTNRVLKSI